MKTYSSKNIEKQLSGITRFRSESNENCFQTKSAHLMISLGKCKFYPNKFLRTLRNGCPVLAQNVPPYLLHQRISFLQ